jgi:hypothetical protein
VNPLRIAVLLAAMGCAVAHANPQVFPLKAFIGFGMEKTANPLVDKAFTDSVKDVAPYVAHFSQHFGQAFGSKVATVLDNKNKSKTFVASLQLSRASMYTVARSDGTVEHSLPVTVSLNITNPLTGEVVYALSKTQYEQFSLLASRSQEEKNAVFAQSYERSLKALIQELSKEAADQFKPAEIKAAVSRQWKGLILLDRGVDAGVAKGDNLSDVDGNLIEVIHAGAAYSVAQPILVKKIANGAEFGRFTAMSAKDLKKPKVLILSGLDATGANTPEFFAQGLGKDAAFSLTPVNMKHQSVLNEISNQTGLAQDEVTQKRALPEYFIRLNTLPVLNYDVPTRNAAIQGRVYEARLFGELVDRNGRVLFAASGDDRIQDDVVDGKAFDLVARREILLKNASGALAKAFTDKVRFKQLSVPVVAEQNKIIEMDDRAGVLSVGQGITIFRKVDQHPTTKEDMWVPMWQADVVERNKNKVKVGLIAPLSPELKDELPKAGDATFLEVAGGSGADSLKFAMCPDVKSQLGEVNVPEFADLAFFAMGERTKWPFYTEWDSFGLGIRNLTANAGFKGELKLKSGHQGGKCIEALYQIDPAGKGRQCASGKCKVTLSALAGYQVQWPSGEKVFAQEVEVSIDNVPEKVADTVIRSELIGKLKTLLIKSADEMNKDDFSK